MGSRVLKIRGPFGSLVDLSNPEVRSPYRQLKRQSGFDEDFQSSNVKDETSSFVKFKNALKQRVTVARKKKNAVVIVNKESVQLEIEETAAPTESVKCSINFCRRWSDTHFAPF